MKKSQQPRSRKISKVTGTKSTSSEPIAMEAGAPEEPKRPTKLDEVIAKELAADPAVITDPAPGTSIVPYVDEPFVDESVEASRETSLEKIYGKRGVPSEDNVLPFVLPPSITRPGPDLSQAETQRIIDAREKRLAEQKEKDDAEKMAMLTPKHSVTVVRNPDTPYPELWWKVFIQGPRWEEAAFADMFTRAKCSRADSLEEADLVVFTGGDDVNPALYGEKPHPTVSWDDDRDTADIAAYWKCYQSGIPMLGVCRGAQFLHVMQGGKLYQDIDNHQGAHDIYDFATKKRIPASSVHHQAVIRNIDGGMQVLAVSMKSAKNKWFNDKDRCQVGTGGDIEVFFYRDTMVLGVQGHPEYKNYAEFTGYVLETMVECFATHPDMCFLREEEGKGPMYLRIKQEILAERDAKTLVSGNCIRPLLAKMD